jgi:ribonuclease-3
MCRAADENRSGGRFRVWRFSPPARGEPGMSVDPNTLQKCQERISYHFSDLDLLRQALTHASVAPTRLESNERLEFLGDSVLALTVCHELYDGYDDLLEGGMTKIKSAVVSRQTCAEVAEELGLVEWISVGKGLAKPGGTPQSVAAAVLESIIGAIYLDGGLAPARRFVLAHLQARIDEAMADEHQRNYKAILQQHAQQYFGKPPDYQLLDEKGPDHSKCFEIAVTVNGRHFPSAWGTSKKDAEQRAAQRALEELGLLNAPP